MRRQKHAGQTLVEFAFVFPILLLLVMGLFEIGRFVLFYSVLNTAVREGTRFAIVQESGEYGAYPDESGLLLSSCASGQTLAHRNICGVVQEKTFSIGDLSEARLSITHTKNSVDDPLIDLSLEYDFAPVTPGLGLIGDFTINVNSQMLMTQKARGGS